MTNIRGAVATANKKGDTPLLKVWYDGAATIFIHPLTDGFSICGDKDGESEIGRTQRLPYRDLIKSLDIDTACTILSQGVKDAIWNFMTPCLASPYDDKDVITIDSDTIPWISAGIRDFVREVRLWHQNRY